MNLDFLILAGILSWVAALLHIAIVLGGASWYQFFGAGRAMVTMSQQKFWLASFITLAIAAVLFICGLYAFSGAGLMDPLPLLKCILLIITAIYSVRALAGLGILVISKQAVIKDNSRNFWLWSSLICLFIALIHGLGIMHHWQNL